MPEHFLFFAIPFIQLCTQRRARGDKKLFSKPSKQVALIWMKRRFSGCFLVGQTHLTSACVFFLIVASSAVASLELLIQPL